MSLMEEDTLGFDWGEGLKSYPEKRPVCCRFSTNALTEWPEDAGCRNRHLLDLTDLNSEFSFSNTSCLPKAKEPSLYYNLPIAGGRIIGFIPFPRVLVLCEMQLAWPRIWTRVAVSISYDDNHYTTSTFIILIYSSIRLSNLNAKSAG